MKARLQKILSEAGIASRREAEKIILSGRVMVNGKKVTQLGSQADPELDKVSVDGKPIKSNVRKVYYLFYKPVNVIVTRHDPQGRPTVLDYFKNVSERINPVGRLDFDSEGLLLLTNDGALHAKLTHPRHGVPKIYNVKIPGHLNDAQKKKLEVGVTIGDAVTQPCQIRVIKENPFNCWVEIILNEGRNRQIRRMMEVLGLEVLKLIRVGIGPLRVGELTRGEHRSLTPAEVKVLQKLGSVGEGAVGSR
ncbi:MAG: rRNA pseudouridine synthase [Deltaproteobacteria bacterium]|nr:rRNA pseudouridine synthase [Deltaproteobacteria bacterium]